MQPMTSTTWPTDIISQYSYNDNILTALGNLLNCYTETHGKALVVRFDMRYPVNYEKEVKHRDISRCMQKIIQVYKRKGFDPMYMWAREQSSSPHPHYHCVLLLNGNRTQSPYPVFQAAERLWGSTLGVVPDGLINYCTQGKDGTPHENGIMLRRCDANYQERTYDVQRQVSYMAKTEGKGTYNDGIRDYGMSVLPKTTKG